MGVIVTGAEEHQGLAVIRGLGIAGVPVIACGSRPGSLGFRSRYATSSGTYRSPFADPDGFVDDVVGLAERMNAELIIPVVESTLVGLDRRRRDVEQRCALAAPPSDILSSAIDKLRTLAIARDAGVPVPVTLYDADRGTLLAAAKDLPFPVAVKPRGSPIHAQTTNRLGFKVRYANSLEDLRSFFDELPDAAGVPIVQECIPGTAVCVATVSKEGQPITMFPYRRVREVPITGGVSVVRESVPLDLRVEDYVRNLLQALNWTGVAMVEFKYDRSRDRFVLMEINGRFQASTALSLDAGLNLPYLVYCMFTGKRLPSQGGYKIGVRERWLQGDLMALMEYVLGDTIRNASRVHAASLPSRARVVADFFSDFRPGVYYDEFRWSDPKPAITAFRGLMRAAWQRGRMIGATKLRRWRNGLAGSGKSGRER